MLTMELTLFLSWGGLEPVLVQRKMGELDTRKMQGVVFGDKNEKDNQLAGRRIRRRRKNKECVIHGIA